MIFSSFLNFYGGKEPGEYLATDHRKNLESLEAIIRRISVINPLMYEFEGQQAFTNAAYVTMLPTKKIFDDSGIFNTQSGLFKIKESGYYLFSTYLNLTGATAGTGEMILQAIQNAEIKRLARETISSSVQGISGSRLFKCKAGDELKMQFYQSNGATRTNESNNGYVQLLKIGEYL